MMIARLLAVAAIVSVTAACMMAAERPDIPGCDETTDFAFAGETTLAALGLPEFAGGQEAVRSGMIWVTARAVEVDRGPVDGEPQPGMQLLSRMVCVRWPDGSGMAATIDEDWQPPPGLAASPGEARDLPIVIVAAVVVLVVGASVLAFRREGTRAS